MKALTRGVNSAYVYCIGVINGEKSTRKLQISGSGGRNVSQFLCRNSLPGLIQAGSRCHPRFTDQLMS